MKMDLKIEVSSQVPIYKQIINVIQDNIEKGKYIKGEFLPSMNKLAEELDVSKETVKKSYSILREKGVIESSHGKGFYVTNNGTNHIKILLLFDKLSTYKQELYNSFAATIGDIAEITIRLHNQDIELFQKFVEENLDSFDYYAITPHFPLRPEIQKSVLKCLKKIPNRKLLLLDRLIDGLEGNFGSVYQDLEKDIYEGLLDGVDKFKKIKKLNVLSMGSLYAPIIENGIIRFCNENQINYEIHNNFNINKIEKQEAFLILNSQLDVELIEILRAAKLKNYEIGKDIGIISYNDSPINEIVLNGLTTFSTDYRLMGELAAKMILEKSFRKIRCHFKLIQRSTF